jgi:hypothetical protein
VFAAARVTCEYSVYIFSGAPTQTDTIGVQKDMRDGPNSLFLADKSEGKTTRLEDLLKDKEKFEHRPNGGSFSPVRKEKGGEKVFSLPE